MNLEHAVSADEAIASLKSGMRVFVLGAAATPAPLLEALVRNTSLRDMHSFANARSVVLGAVQ